MSLHWCQDGSWDFDLWPFIGVVQYPVSQDYLHHEEWWQRFFQYIIAPDQILIGPQTGPDKRNPVNNGPRHIFGPGKWGFRGAPQGTIIPSHSTHQKDGETGDCLRHCCEANMQHWIRKLKQDSDKVLSLLEMSVIDDPAIVFGFLWILCRKRKYRAFAISELFTT